MWGHLALWTDIILCWKLLSAIYEFSFLHWRVATASRREQNKWRSYVTSLWQLYKSGSLRRTIRDCSTKVTSHLCYVTPFWPMRWFCACVLFCNTRFIRNCACFLKSSKKRSKLFILSLVFLFPILFSKVVGRVEEWVEQTTTLIHERKEINYRKPVILLQSTQNKMPPGRQIWLCACVTNGRSVAYSIKMAYSVRLYFFSQRSIT